MGSVLAPMFNARCAECGRLMVVQRRCMESAVPLDQTKLWFRVVCVPANDQYAHSPQLPPQSVLLFAFLRGMSSPVATAEGTHGSGSRDSRDSSRVSPRAPLASCHPNVLLAVLRALTDADVDDVCRAACVSRGWRLVAGDRKR